jgi:hypothetical protein
MKKALLVLALTLVWLCGPALASKCDGTKGICYEIVNMIFDSSVGNIRVMTNYYLDGALVQEGGSRYDWKTFYGMTEEQMIARIEKDCETHANNLIARSYAKEANEAMVEDGITGLIGKSKTIETTKIQASETKEIEVKADGTVVKTSDIVVTP